MNGSYKIHVTASKWVEAYIDLKNRLGSEPAPGVETATPHPGNLPRDKRRLNGAGAQTR